MPSSRIPSPARSQGARSTPRRYKPRTSRSVCSPARSNNSVKLSAVIMSQMDSFVLSPMPTRRSVLADTTDIDMPRRRSWWRKLGENSREIMEVINSKEPVEADNAIEEYIDVDVLSQEKKNYTFDLPESSDSESISSIVIPQRKLFTQKENQPQKKFGQIINTRETLAKLHKSQAIDEKALNVGPKNLFNQGTKPRSKPIFPSALLNISANKTIANKTKDQPINEVKGQVRSLFGNKPGTKRKNMFADFIVSESEDEMPVAVSQKLEQKRKASLNNRAEREPSPASITDIEIDDWRLLPSSTMVDHQLEEGLRITPNKRARLDKLSEGTESNNTIANKTKQSNKSKNKSINSKNKSNIKEVPTSDAKNEDKLDNDISMSQNQTTRKSLRRRDTSVTNASLERSSRKENTKNKDTKNASKTQTQKVNSINVAVENNSKNIEAKNKSNQTNTRSRIDQALQSEDDEDDFTLEYDNDDEPVKENKDNETIKENKSQNAQHISKVSNKGNITSNTSKKLQSTSKDNKDQADKNEIYEKEMQVENVGEGEAERDQNRENYEKTQNGNQEIENYDRAEKEHEQEEQQYDEVMQEEDFEKQEQQLETSLKISPNKKVRESHNATANKTSQSNVSTNSKNKSKNLSKLNEVIEQANAKTVEEPQDYVEEEMQESKDELQEVEIDGEGMELENEDNSEAEEEKDKNDSSVQNEDQEMATDEEDHESEQEEQENGLEEEKEDQIEQGNDVEEHGQENTAEEQGTDQEEQDDENNLQEQEPDQDYNKSENDDGEEANFSNQNDISEVENDVHDQVNSEVEEDEEEADNTDQNISQEVENEEDMEDKEESEAEDEEQGNDSDHDESQDQAGDVDMQDSVQNESQELEDNDEEENQNESEVEVAQEEEEEVEENEEVEEDEEAEEDEEDEEDEAEKENTNNSNINVSQDLEDAEERQTSHDNDKDDEDDAEDILDNDTDPNDIQSDNEHEVRDDIDNDSDADDNNEIRSQEDNEVQNTAENAETNSTHDTTGRHRKKHESKVSSPEAILHDKTREMESFVKGRNTSVRKTKSMIKSLNIRPSLAPVRESTGFSDGSGDSNAGSGWDSHRTTRVTMRKTFGKDFTPRKSLRTLVMEKSAKQQTAANLEANAEISKLPQANSTELPEPFDMHEDDDDACDDDDGGDDNGAGDDDDAGDDNDAVYNNDAGDNDDVDDHDGTDDLQDMQESDHEVSRRTRQTTLESYLQKIKQQNADRRKQLDEEIRSALQKNAPRTDVFNSFKVPAVPKRRIRPMQTKPKAKPVKSVIPLDMLPPELLEDMKYKPPKRYRPANASWITKRLYKFLETKLEPKYDYKARIRSEKLVETIYNFTKEIRRQTVASSEAVDLLKHEMARLDVVKTHFDFYEFFHEFMPREVRVKVVPDVFNKISLPKHGVFSDILR